MAKQNGKAPTAFNVKTIDKEELTHEELLVTDENFEDNSAVWSTTESGFKPTRDSVEFNNERVDTETQLSDEELDQLYKDELWKKTAEPTKHVFATDSRSRLAGLKGMVGHHVPEGFDPFEISWVLPNLGVTGAEGADTAIDKSYFVINVADELNNNATVKMPVEPSAWYRSNAGSVLPTLNKIVDTMQIAMDSGQRVVVHCSMGMERSVLATVWYLTRTQGLSLDNAYNLVRSIRPIATDRREWIIQ